MSSSAGCFHKEKVRKAEWVRDCEHFRILSVWASFWSKWNPEGGTDAAFEAGFHVGCPAEWTGGCGSIAEYQYKFN